MFKTEKYLKNIIVFLISFSFFLCCIFCETSSCTPSSNFPQENSQWKDFPELYGPYLGQELPGTEPVIFADGIVNRKRLHTTPSVSPDGNAIYWAEFKFDSPKRTICFSKKVNNRWIVPEILIPNSNYRDDCPVFSPDGKTLYFNSNRPWPGNTGTEHERIWYMKRQADGSWSSPLPIDRVINDYALHWQVSVDNNGTLYFGSERTPNYGMDDIFCSEYKDGHFGFPVNLGPPVNTSEHESIPFIDPEGRFLLFARPAKINGNLTRTCIWISRKQTNGTWSEPANVTAAYPNFEGACAKVTPDGKYIFHLRYINGSFDVYWVSSEILDDF